MPLVTVLPILQPLLLAFACLFSKPQRRHFDYYLQGLLCQDFRRSVRGMSRQVVEGPDASAVDRFVTTAPWEHTGLTRRWHVVLRKGLRQHRPPALRIAGRRTGFLIFDDTQHPRTSRDLEGVGYHWSHTEGQSVRSHSLVVGAYRCGDYTFAYSCDVYVRQAEIETLRAQRTAENLRRPREARRELWEFRSKIDLVVAQLAQFRPLVPDEQVFVLFDSWYLNARVVAAARARGLDWASVLKPNRVVHLLHLSLETGESETVARLPVAELVAQLVPAAALAETGVPYPQAAVPAQWQTVKCGGRTFRVVAYRARLAGIGVVQLVLAQQQYHNGRWSPVFPLVTNRLDLTPGEVVTVYLERWSIEVLIRDGKQQLGLTDGQFDRLESNLRHWALALVSQALLTLLRLQADAGVLRTPSGRPIPSVGRTLGEVRQFVKQCALVELIRWVCAQAAAGATPEEIALRLELPA